MSAKSKRKIQPLKAIGRFFIILTLIGIITGCILACFMTVYVLTTLENIEPINIEDLSLNYTTLIYAEDAETGEYVEIQRVDSDEDRVWVDYNDIPPHLLHAVIAIEDKRFDTHFGVDLQRTIAATFNGLNPFSTSTFGGSTITQQLIKNVTGDNAVTIPRKIREIFSAIVLERHYSKEQILEAYLNVVSFGLGINGIESAANNYFGKSASELTIAESAAIVGITQNPSKWSPFRYPENNEIRQGDVLFAMHEQGRISDEQYEAALAEELHFEDEKYQESQVELQDWFMDTVYEEIIDDLVERNGYTETGAEQLLFNGGLRIYTTVDTDIQNYLNTAFIDIENNFPAVLNEEYPESSIVIIDHQTGQIKGIMGSNRPRDGVRLFNRATDALRHPGSTIKPISIYAPAIEYNLINYSTMLEDSPILLDENDPNSIYPRNVYNDYYGDMTVHEAVMRSANTIPVKLSQQLTPQLSFNFLRDELGFDDLVENENRNGRYFTDMDISPMALGSMTDGVTMVDMAAAFQMFGNGGLYIEPHSYTKVLDADGNVILENNYVPTRVISQDTATIMNKLLQQVVSGPLGTGAAAKMSGWELAGKTGTSNDNVDQLFMGVTPYYSVSVWMGYDTPEPINYALYPPTRLYKSMMEPIHQNLEPKTFEVANNVISLAYCADTGLKATEDCPTQIEGFYKITNQPHECTEHNGTSSGGSNVGNVGGSDGDDEDVDYGWGLTWDPFKFEDDDD